MRKGSLLAAFAAVVTFFLVAQVASAQYPPPKSTMVCAVNQIDVKTGSSTAVAATLHDTTGAVLSGYNVSFSVVSGDAHLSSTGAMTDGSGTAVVTVTFGANAGPVIVHAASDTSECQASTQVLGIVPPSTGDAGLLDGSRSSEAATFVGLGLGLVLMAAGAVAIRKSVTA